MGIHKKGGAFAPPFGNTLTCIELDGLKNETRIIHAYTKSSFLEWPEDFSFDADMNGRQGAICFDVDVNSEWKSFTVQGNTVDVGARSKVPEYLPAKKWPDLAIASPGFECSTHLLLMDDLDVSRPGDSRKLNNLRIYIDLAKQRFTDAKIRLGVLTNSRDSAKFTRLQETLGDETQDSEAKIGWRFLSLHKTGDWVSDLVSRADPRVRDVLRSYAEWTRSL